MAELTRIIERVFHSLQLIQRTTHIERDVFYEIEYFRRKGTLTNKEVSKHIKQQSIDNANLILNNSRTASNNIEDINLQRLKEIILKCLEK